jgi:hypothetical protein
MLIHAPFGPGEISSLHRPCCLQRQHLVSTKCRKHQARSAFCLPIAGPGSHLRLPHRLNQTPSSRAKRSEPRDLLFLPPTPGAPSLIRWSSFFERARLQPCRSIAKNDGLYRLRKNSSNGLKPIPQGLKRLPENGRRNSRSLHYATPDFLWNWAALSNFMRLSFTERRIRGPVKCCVAGNPGTLRSG